MPWEGSSGSVKRKSGDRPSPYLFESTSKGVSMTIQIADSFDVGVGAFEEASRLRLTSSSFPDV